MIIDKQLAEMRARANAYHEAQAEFNASDEGDQAVKTLLEKRKPYFEHRDVDFLLMLTELEKLRTPAFSYQEVCRQLCVDKVRMAFYRVDGNGIERLLYRNRMYIFVSGAHATVEDILSNDWRLKR